MIYPSPACRWPGFHPGAAGDVNGAASGFGRLTPELRPSAGNNLFVFALQE